MRFENIPDRLREGCKLENFSDVSNGKALSTLMSDAALMVESLKRSDTFTHKEIYALGQKLFGAAMRHAEENGETVMEDKRDEHAWSVLSGLELLRAAAEYFDNTI